MADQRITGVNLAPEGGTLKPGFPEDYTRWAALHNHLIERGLQQSGRDTGDTKTWWDLYGSGIDSLPQKLTPALQEFFKLAWVSWDGSSSPGQLFWNISTIPSPDRLFSSGINEAYKGLDTLDFNIYSDEAMRPQPEDDYDSPPHSSDEEFEDDDPWLQSPVTLEKYRFVTLYEAQSCALGNAPLGVIYDQKYHVAAFVSSTEDIPTLLNGHNNSKFTALEEILDKWHQLMDREKVVKRHGVWKMQYWSPVDLSDTLRHWDDLLDAIESRFVQDEESLLEVGSVQTLLDPAAASSLVLSDFRLQFLTQARRPRFQWIAPGIRVPSSEELEERIRATTQEQSHESNTREYPLLLFAIPEPNAAEDSYTWPSHYRSRLTQQVNLTDTGNTSGELLFPFAKGIKPDASFVPGLYFSSTGEEEEVPFADAFRLVLPFTLGNGLTVRTDFTWEQGEKEVVGLMGHLNFNSSPRYAELYQMGNGISRGISRHDAPLAQLFRTWKRQIGYGSGWGLHWEKSAGVIGQIGGEITGVGIIEEYASSYQRCMHYVIGHSI